MGRALAIPGTSRVILALVVSRLFRKGDYASIIKIHFSFFEIIQKHYKLRSDPFHLSMAINACQASISFSDMVLKSFDANDYAMYKELKNLGVKEISPRTLLRPRHIGFQQYRVILKKQKNLDLMNEVMRKHDLEGWGQGTIQIK
jgi:hypothetical protein